MRTKITLLFVLTALILTSCSSTLKFMDSTALELVKNKDVQKYGATISGFLYVWFNSKQDATQHNGQFYIDKDGFHRYKHWSNVFGAVTVGLKTAGWITGNYTLWDITKRTAAEGALWFQAWQNFYDLWKYDKILDYREGIWNDHRYVQPFGDRYMKFKAWQMIGIDGGMTTAGLYYLLKH